MATKSKTRKNFEKSIKMVNGQIDPEVIAKMVQEANIDVEEVTGITMARFRDIYLGNESNKTAEE